MTCLHSPFAAAEGEPTVPQGGQSHPDVEGEKLVWVLKFEVSLGHP